MLNMEPQSLDRKQGQHDTSVSYYESIQSDVLKARNRFSNWVATLPTGIQKEVRKLSKGNLRAPMPGNLLGERDAFWFGEMLNVDEEVKQQAAIGSIAGYSYFVHQDRVIDHDVYSIGRSIELAMNFLYMKMIECFSQLAPSSNDFWVYFNKYLEEYTIACAWEIGDGSNLRSFTAHDLRRVAHRSAMAKLVPVTLALASGQSYRICKIEQAIEHLTLGLQIKDDLTDVSQDLAEGKWSYVISRIIGNRPKKHNFLVRGLVWTKTCESLLAESARFMKEAEKLLELVDGSALKVYIDYICEQNYCIMDDIFQIKSKVSSEMPNNWEAPLGLYENQVWHEISQILPRCDSGY